METNRKIIGNAISAYFLIFVSIFFFFNKENSYINNDFVKSHTKTAFLLHCLFLFVYIIFISLELGLSIQFLGFSLNVILASSFFIILFGLLMYGVYHANKGKVFTISDILTITKTKDLVEVQEDKELSEKEKFALIVSYVPFLGYFTYGRHLGDLRIKSIVKMNLLCASIIAFFYVVGGNNIATFLTLIYTVYVVFSAITLVVKDEIIALNIDKIPIASEEYIWTKTLFAYLKNHLGKKDETPLKELYAETKTAHYTAEKKRHDIQKGLKDIPLPHALIYIPVINIITLPFVKGRYKFHIINGITISLIFIGLVLYFGYQSIVPLLVAFPASFGLGYTERLGYKMPYIYDFYGFFAGIVNGIKKLFHRGREVQNKEETVSMKVGETQTDTPSTAETNKNQ